MQSRAARILVIVIVSVLVLWVVKYVLFDSSPVPEDSNYSLNLEQIRQMARQQPGALPLQVNGLLVADGSFPASAVVAGDGLLHKRALVFTSFQIDYGNRSVILDTVHDAEAHAANFGDEGFKQAAYEQMQTAMQQADLILATHEHLDHVGGIAKSPHLAEITPRTLLLRDQVHGPTIGQAGFPEGSLEKFRDFDYEQMHSPAPGIVLIKAPGHSTGSQIVYVALAGGEEFLFVGDIVWHMDSIRRLTGRPRIVSLAFLGEDRDAVAAQIRTLHEVAALHHSGQLNIVVAHDADQWQELLGSGTIQSGFRLN